MIGEVLGEVSVPEGFSPDSVKQLILRPKSAIATWPEFNQTDDSFKESVMQVRNKIKIIRKEHPEAFMKFTFVPCLTSHCTIIKRPNPNKEIGKFLKLFETLIGWT